MEKQENNPENESDSGENDSAESGIPQAGHSEEQRATFDELQQQLVDQVEDPASESAASETDSSAPTSTAVRRVRWDDASGGFVTTWIEPHGPDAPAADTWADEYESSVAAFLASASWLTAAELPLAVQLQAMARTLDKGMRTDGVVQSALASAFGMTWARLQKAQPKGPASEADPMAGLLQPFPGME